MHTRAPTAFMLSLALHAGAVLAVVALAFAVQHNQPPAVHVFELVAGPPTDLSATEAPARGSREGTVEVKVHETPARTESLRPEGEPVVRPETKPVPKKSAPAGPRVSYKDFIARHPPPAASRSGAAAQPAARAPQLKTHGIPDGVTGGSSASHGGGGGKALTAAQHSALEGYVSRLVGALQQTWFHLKPPGLSDLLSADVEYLVAADGSISGVHIQRGSGNAAFDESCVEAFKEAGSIGPTPDGEPHALITTFRMTEEDQAP